MAPVPELITLETDRLALRRQAVGDAVIFRRLWMERDVRVPPHRQIDVGGHPTVVDIAAQISEAQPASRPGLLTVERKDVPGVLGYCGLVFHGNGAPDEPELAFELLRAVHNRGFATEAGQAVVSWASEAGYGRLWATVWDWNIASRRVLAKLGFRDTGREGSDTPYGRSLLTVRDL